MTKKYHPKYFRRIIIILFILCLFNIHFKKVDTESFKTFRVSGTEKVLVGRSSFVSVHCDKPTVLDYCVRETFPCKDQRKIYYHWSTDLMGAIDEDWMTFSGDGVCILKYKTWAAELDWL